MKHLCLFFISAFFSASSFAYSGNWHGKTQIKSLQQEIYRNTSDGGKPTLVETTLRSSTCGGTTWVLGSTQSGSNELFTTLLAAHMNKQSVSLYEWSCVRVYGKSYPRIGGVKVH